MSVPQICGLLSTLCMTGSYYTYWRQIRLGHSTPNLVTSLLFIPITIVNAITYSAMLDKDFLKAITALVVCGFTVLLCGYILLWKKYVFKNTSATWITGGLALTATIVWLLTDATIGNLMIQVVLIACFIPIIHGLLDGHLKERPLAWVLAATAYAISTIPLLLHWEGFAPLAFPLLNGVLGNGTIAILAVTHAHKYQHIE